MHPSHIVAVGSGLDKNGAGRVFSVWLVARAAGLGFTYVATRSDEVWAPLTEATEFLASVRVVERPSDRLPLVRQLLDEHRDAVVLVFKNLPRHIAMAEHLRTVAPVIVDVDDAELEAQLSHLRAVSRLGLVSMGRMRDGRHPWQLRRAISHSRRFTMTVSNPSLQSLYPSIVLPHVRLPHVNDDASTSGADRCIRLCFVGTPRPHKGIAELRSAAAHLAQRHEVQLTVTAPAPDGARPWERWVGKTTLDAGVRIVQEATVVVIPSRPGWWGDYQFPVKLVDALQAGKPLVVTSVWPLVWAAGDAALVVPPEDPIALAAAVESIAGDQMLARRLAGAARARATAFEPSAAVDALREAMALAVVAARSGR